MPNYNSNLELIQ